MSLSLDQYLLLALLGAVAGFINVMAGGGSLLTLPVMVIMGLPGPLANGSNRIAILIQCIVAVFGFFRKGFSDFRLSLSLGLCTVPGAVLGAWYGTRLEGVWFNRVLAGIMVAVMLLMAGKSRASGAGSESPPAPSRPRRLAAHACMVVIGFYGGFIQAGVGFLLMAVLHRVLGLDLVRVNMHKVFIVTVFTAVALIVFAIRGQVLWSVGLCLAVGNALGGWISAHVQIRQGERLVRRVLLIALAGLVVKLLWV